MGTTLTPINSFTLPDDNEPLKNVFAHQRQHAAQLEAALKSRGLATPDVTGYLGLQGQVNTHETRLGTLEAASLLPYGCRATASNTPSSGVLWGTGAWTIAGQRGGWTAGTTSSERLKCGAAAGGLYHISWTYTFSIASSSDASLLKLIVGSTTASDNGKIQQPGIKGANYVATMSGLVDIANSQEIWPIVYHTFGAGTQIASSTVQLVRLGPSF